MTRQLIINPGSTSTKIAVFEEETQVFSASLPMDPAVLASCGTLQEQIPVRLAQIRSCLAEGGFDIASFDNIMCRGGMIWGIGMGAYLVDDELVRTLADEQYTSPHASNLGGMLGQILAKEAGCSACIYDAVTAASLPPVAKVTGFPDIIRRSSCHVLNSHAVAEQYAADIGVPYQTLRLLVAHLGGGISFCAIDRGQIIDSIGDDDGPFSPERSGFTQILPIIKMCYSGDFTYEEMKKKVRGGGGLKAYLGTSDLREIEKMIEGGDERAALLFEAQAYQIAKGIGELSIAFRGECDAVLLTGGLAYSKRLTDLVSSYVPHVAPIRVYPGEREMEALALGGLRIMRGKEDAKRFHISDIAT